MILCHLHMPEEEQTHTFPLFTNYKHFILNAFYTIPSFYCTDVRAGIILLPAFVEMSCVLGLNDISFPTRLTCAFG